jgi:hypothetical protein
MTSLLADLPFSRDIVLPAAIFGILAVGVTLYKVIFALGDYEGLGLPLAGEPEGKQSFSFKTRLRYYYDCVALYNDAYYRVS